MAKSLRDPATALSALSKSRRMIYVIATVVAVLVVVGALAALGGFSGGSGSGPGGGGSYAVEFAEHGLPGGTTWSVTLSGTTITSAQSTIAFSEPDGTYVFAIGIVAGYHATPESGQAQVNGSSWYTGITFSPTPTPIGSAFAVGNPALGACPANATYTVNGCNGSDETYSLTIETSAVTFGSVLFEVLASTGAVYTIPMGTGGFSIMTPAGAVAAQIVAIGTSDALEMTSGWTTFGLGLSNSSSLSSLDTILIDMGPMSTSGDGLAFEVTGTGSYGGTTSPLILP